jgi:hypothetical protein
LQQCPESGEWGQMAFDTFLPGVTPEAGFHRDTSQMPFLV